jgi:hypothetical protein
MSKSRSNIDEIRKDDFFVVPDGYFEESRLEILDKAAKKFNLIEHSPKNVFEVPNFYFENLGNEIIEKTQKKNLFYFDKLKLIYTENKISITALASMAACLLIVITYAFINNKSGNSCQNYLCDVSNKEIIEYLKTDNFEHSDFILLEEKFDFLEIKTENKINQQLLNYSDIEDDLI